MASSEGKEELVRYNPSLLYLDPACLCPNGLDLLFAPLADIEQGLNNANFLTDTLPVEEMLVFLGGKMNQNAVIRFHRINQDICQASFYLCYLLHFFSM